MITLQSVGLSKGLNHFLPISFKAFNSKDLAEKKKLTGRHWTRKMTQLVKGLPYKQEDWSLDLQHPQKILNTMALACNPNTEVRKSRDR